MNKRTRLALIYGGMGLESEISVIGAKNLYRYVKDVFEVVPIFVDKNGVWLTKVEITKEYSELPESSELTLAVTPINLGKRGCLISCEGEILPIDVAFPLLHGDFGEDGSIQGSLETANIPYFGCKPAESGLCYDKIYTKILADSLGIPTAKWISAIDTSTDEARRKAESEIGYPMFVKPARLGSSFGACPVKDSKGFESAYATAKKLGSGRVLIEKLVNVSSELECVYFKAKNKELFTKIGEIKYESDFYDYDTKYKFSSSASVIPDSVLDDDHGDKIREYSKRLRELIGIRDLARFDFFLDSTGKILFNEINTIPGFTDKSLAPELIKSSFDDLETVLSSALSARASRN